MTTDDEPLLATYRHVEELVAQRRDGRLSDADLMAALLARIYTEGESDPSVLGSGYIPGSWDAVRYARLNELLSDKEFRVLVEKCRRVP